MTDAPTTTSTPAMPLNERIVFGLRQAAFIAAALLVAGLVTERLQPVEAVDRGIVSTPFLWAIVVWFAVLMINAVAYERSQMPKLEGVPLYCALVVGAFMFLSGLVGLDAGTFGRRVSFIFATSLGAVMFWWGIFGLGYLIIRRLKD